MPVRSVDELTLDLIDTEAELLATLQSKHTNALADWAKAGAKVGSATTAFHTVSGYAHAIRRAEERISALLDGALA